MFWGLIMEPERRYTQFIKKSFHISMAALDIASSGEEPSQVMCGYEGRNYLLCTLKQPDMLQCHLDLEFSAGSQVSFASNGKAHVHLTGYLTDELNLGDLEEQEDEEEVEEEQQQEEKRGKKKKLKIKNNMEPAPKKVKMLNELLNGSVEKEDGESDDPDFDEENEEEGDNEESGEEEESDEDEEVAEEEDDSEGEECDEEGEEQQEEVPQKLTKKQKKLLKQQQQQQQLNGEAKKPKKEQKQQQKKQKKMLEKGVIVEDLVEGNGPPAKPGRFINVYYEGRLEKNNKMFDSTNKGPGFKFRLGSGEVIKAWDIGLAGMKVGGKRKIVCPPHTAYGLKGSPPAIPPNSTLVFTVELKKIH